MNRINSWWWIVSGFAMGSLWSIGMSLARIAKALELITEKLK